MVKKVQFHPRVKIRQNGDDLQSIDLNDQPIKLNVDPPITTFTSITAIIILILLAVFATWMAGMIKMGMCQGSQTGYFWATLLIFLLIPGPGTVAGFIMAIIALAMLRRGKSFAGMKCR